LRASRPRRKCRRSQRRRRCSVSFVSAPAGRDKHFGHTRVYDRNEVETRRLPNEERSSQKGG
jgi:hypothetical protein